MKGKANLEDYLWPFAGTVLGLVAMPVAIAQYPDFFNENEWLLPLSVVVVLICWLVPLSLHQRAVQIYRRILGIRKLGPAIAVALLLLAVYGAYLGGASLLRRHRNHLAAVLAKEHEPKAAPANGNQSPATDGHTESSHQGEQSTPSSQPHRSTALKHHSGEGFMQIGEAADNPAKVIDIGSPIRFQVIATNTGREAVNNLHTFSSFIPVGEFSPDFPHMSDRQVIKKFHELRDKAVAEQKKSGLMGETLGPGEQRFSLVGTHEQTLKQADLDSFYAKRTKFYLLGWVEWRTLNGITESNEQCVWLEPPNPPSPNPEKLLWNECHQP